MDPALVRFRRIARRFQGRTGWEVGTPPERAPLVTVNPESVEDGDLRAEVRPGWDGVDPDLIERFRDPDLIALFAVASADPTRADAEVRAVPKIAKQALDALTELSRIASVPVYGPPMTRRMMRALATLHYIDPRYRGLARMFGDAPKAIDEVVDALATLRDPPPSDDRFHWLDALGRIGSVNGCPVSHGTRDLLAQLARVPPPGRGRPRDYRTRAMLGLLDSLKHNVGTVYRTDLSDSEALDLLALLDPLDRFRLHDPATRERFVAAIRKRRQRA